MKLSCWLNEEGRVVKNMDGVYEGELENET